LTAYFGNASFSSITIFIYGFWLIYLVQAIVVQVLDKLKFTTVSFLMVISLLVVSCASAPVQEMSDARQAIQAAKEAGVPSEQPNLMKAEALLKDAESALQELDYKKAKHTAKQARNEAVQAQKSAPEVSPAPKPSQ